jgi:hypothetical protein
MEPSVEDLIKEFKYKIQPSDTHEELLREMTAYYKENEKWLTKRNVSASIRARKHLMRAYTLCRERRIEIIEERKDD